MYSLIKTILNRIKSLWKTVLSFFRKRWEYPKQITDENFSEWKDKAKKIKKRYYHPVFILLMAGFIVALGVSIAAGLVLLMFQLWNQYTITFGQQINTILAMTLLLLMVLISMAIASYLSNYAAFLFSRYLGYPTVDELIFAECIIIAGYLREDNRLEAKKECISELLPHMKSFLHLRKVNPRRAVYKPEFSLIIKGANAMKRMLMFANERVSDYFVNFGLRFVRGEDPSSYFWLERLTIEIQKFGQPKGLLQRVLGSIERHSSLMDMMGKLLLFISGIAVAYYLGLPRL